MDSCSFDGIGGPRCLKVLVRNQMLVFRFTLELF